jgi:hypothetical protein
MGVDVDLMNRHYWRRDWRLRILTQLYIRTLCFRRPFASAKDGSLAQLTNSDRTKNA